VDVPSLTRSRQFGRRRNLRILHVIPAFYPATFWGGPIYSTYGLCKATAEIAGISLRVLTTDSAGPSTAQRLPAHESNPIRYPPGYEVYFCRRLAGAAVSLELLGRLLNLARWADIIHLTGVYSFPTIPTLLLARILRIPLVWSPRGALQASYEWTGARRRTTKRIWEKLCNRIIKGQGWVFHVTSEPERHGSLQLIPAAHAEVVPNGIEVNENGQRRTWRLRGQLRVLFLGRLDPKKGLENLIDALSKFRSAELNLNICGSGDVVYVKSLRQRVETLGLSQIVTFRGHVADEEKANVFARADVCVLPSYSENFGMVVCEALAHGVPVIVSTRTPWGAVADHGCGYWVPNDPDSLARALRAIQQEDLESMGRRGRAWMRRDFDWGRIARRMYGIYEEAITRRKPQGGASRSHVS
jgi:glycosyltransferase involved in cell wall biosynthesis